MEELNQEIQTENQIEVVEPSLEALREGKISFKDIPKEKRHEIRMQARETLPDEEAKEAFDMGWSPKEFFLGKRADGSEKPFVDYKEFLAKINETAPVKNERLRSLSKENQEKDRQIEELKSEMRKLFEMNKIKAEQEVSGQEEKIKAELAEAEELGDIASFKRAQLKLNRLEEDKARLKSFETPAPETFQTPEIPQEILKEVQEWTAKNPWYYSDERIQNYCNQQSGILAQTRPDMPLSQRLELVKQQARSIFPEIVPATQKPAVLPGKTTGLNAAPKVSMSYDQLPEGERKVGDWMIKAGVYKSKQDVVQAYLKREKEKGAK